MASDVKKVTKQSYFFPPEVAEEILRESKRLERPLSWVMQRAWKFAKTHIATIPGPDGTVTPKDEED